MEKQERKQRSKERRWQMAEVIFPPWTPLVLQNVAADVAGGKHTAFAERLEGQHISSSGGNMNKRWSGKQMLTMWCSSNSLQTVEERMQHCACRRCRKSHPSRPRDELSWSDLICVIQVNTVINYMKQEIKHAGQKNRMHFFFFFKGEITPKYAETTVLQM